MKFVTTLFSLGLLRAANLLIPLLWIPIALRTLEPGAADALFIFFSVATLSQTVVDYSSALTTYSHRQSTALAVVWSRVVSAQVLLGAAVALAAGGYFLAALAPGDALTLTIFHALAILAFGLLSSWIYLLLGRTFRNSVRATIARLASAGLVYAYVLSGKPLDLVTALFIYTAPVLCVAVFEFVRVQREQRLGLRLSARGGLRFLDREKYIFFGGALPLLYINVPVMVLPFIVAEGVFTEFFCANRVTFLIIALSQIVSRALLMRSDKHLDRLGIVSIIAFAAVATICAGIYAVSDQLFALMGLTDPRAGYAHDALLLLLISVPFGTISFFWLFCYFAPQGLSSMISRRSMPVSIAGLLIAFVAVYFGGVIGLCVAFIINRVLFFTVFALRIRHW